MVIDGAGDVAVHAAKDGAAMINVEKIAVKATTMREEKREANNTAETPSTKWPIEQQLLCYAVGTRHSFAGLLF